ncbi:MAG TPA: ArsR family transcriptional regulator [Candidatus Methanoperedenaceae archaeon]|nr:ArsR family transcriptional regulator [Candidatus Methanoperedenaceae archaeon]
MKSKDVEVLVMSDREYGEHLNRLFEKVGRGEVHEPHKIVARMAEDIGKILTKERLRLLRIIREKRPGSISELARMLERKESNVYNDLAFLEGVGLLELKEGKNHVKRMPVVDYDALHITVSLTE